METDWPLIITIIVATALIWFRIGNVVFRVMLGIVAGNEHDLRRISDKLEEIIPLLKSR